MVINFRCPKQVKKIIAKIIYKVVRRKPLCGVPQVKY